MTPDPPLKCPCGDTAGPFARTDHGWICEDCLTRPNHPEQELDR